MKRQHQGVSSPRAFRSWTAGLFALLAASCAETPRDELARATGDNTAPAVAAGPAQNPYLLASYNNQSHWNDAATDSTDLAVPRGHYRVTPNSYALVPSDSLGIPAYRADVGGAAVHWFFSGTSLRKLHWEGGRFVEIDRRTIRQDLENFRTLPDGERLQQAETLRSLLERGDEAGVFAYLQSQPNRLLTAVEDQVAQGVLYSLMTVDHAFIGANARGLVRIDQEDPADPHSRLAEPLQTTLPDTLFNDEKVRRGTIFQSDSVFGLGMTFNGFLVVSTVGGKIATLDRRSFRLIDVFAPADPAELFTNSFATSEEAGGGAVYVASNRKMYRLVVDRNGRIRSDAQSGAWEAAYDFGERVPGKIADGTGATPTLMGFGPGEDRLVVLTDGRPRMRLVAFWRDTPPQAWRADASAPSPRIADQIEVNMGAEFPMVQSEQSVAVYGTHAFVLNSVPSAPARPLLSRSAFYRGLLAGFTRPLPRGIAMFQWDHRTHRWGALWSRADVGTVATVPMISGASRMVIVNGVFGDRLGDLYHLGFDLDTGALVMSIASSADPIFNGAFTGIKCDQDGSLMYTTMFGLLRMDVSAMASSAAPDGS